MTATILKEAMRTLVSLWLCTIVLCGLSKESEAAQGCASDTIGIDVSLANNYSGAFLGECPAETFLAADTLLEFLRVWRAASETDNVIGMHLYITDTRPWGRPDLTQILLDGPTIVHEFGDGIHPIEFKWEWDPPLVLPHKGLYAFFLMESPCVGFWDIYASGNPALYTDGDMWFTSRSGCVLTADLELNMFHYPQWDVVFQAGFCHDVASSTVRKTWGQLK